MLRAIAQRALPFALVLACLAPSQAQAYPEGFYISLGIGGATVSGDRGVALKPDSGCPSASLFLWKEPGACRVAGTDPGAAARFDEISRTDYGSGLGVQFRMGYNIAGHVSLEASISGHGATDATEGAGHASFQLRWHFLKLLEVTNVVTERAYDADVMVGVGYSIGGYTPSAEVPGVSGDQEKGWEGINVTTGLAFNYQVANAVSIGLDLKFIFPMYNEFIANWDKSYRSEPLDGAGGMVFIPTVNVNFHVL